jgi:hypothetical protein
MKKLTRFSGFTALNVKTNRFVDYDGKEYESSYSVWETPEGAQEIIDEIDWYAKKYNNKFARKLRRNLKNFKVVKVVEHFEAI